MEGKPQETVYSSQKMNQALDVICRTFVYIQISKTWLIVVVGRVLEEEQGNVLLLC